MSGSSTVYPIVLEQAEAFSAATGVAISVEGPVQGMARKFCDGEVPIARLAALLLDEELAACEANGIEYIELRRAIDGITVITSTANDLVGCVSFNDLYALRASACRPGRTPMRLPRCGRNDVPRRPLRCTDPARSPGR